MKDFDKMIVDFVRYEMEIASNEVLGLCRRIAGIRLVHPSKEWAGAIDREHNASNMFATGTILEVLELLAEKIVNLGVFVLALIVAVNRIAASIARLGVFLAAERTVVGGFGVGSLGVGSLGVGHLGVGHLGVKDRR